MNKLMFAALVFLALHLIFCFLFSLVVLNSSFRVRGGRFLLPFFWLIPVWGPLALALACVCARDTAHTETLLERLRINEEAYRSVIVAGSSAVKQAIPLEEALIINDRESRRSLLMSVLREAPEEHMALLRQARMNEDTEVVHYAATAMAQVSRNEELSLQRAAHAYAAAPDSEEALAAYTAQLEHYLEQGMAHGRSLEIQRRQYAKLLEKQLAAGREEGAGSRAAGVDGGHISARRTYQETARKLAEILLVLGDFRKAEDVIGEMLRQDPDSETAWLLRVRSCAQQQDGAGLRAAIEQIDRQQVYLSAAAREQLDFWATVQPCKN